VKTFRLIVLLTIVTLVLAACERPARDTVEVVTPPSTAPLEDKPADDLTIPSTDGTPAAGEGEAMDDGSGDAAPTEGDGTTGEVTEGEPAADETTGEDEAPAAGEDIIYVVQAGDTLSTIALLYGVDIQDVITVNSLTNPDNLEVGQQLIIPLSGNVTPPGGGDSSGGEVIHTVAAGETLFLIARAYGVEMQAIIDLNGLTDPDRLEVGQQLRIPQ